MNHNLQIQKILLKVADLPHFDDKIRVLKEAIQIADMHNDIEWGFDLRLDLIRQERNTSKCQESFPAFAWLLHARDSDPDLFEESDFLWEYKWMVASACRNTAISKEQILQISDDLRLRLERNGYTARAYHNVMTSWYLHLGDYAQTRESIALADAEMVDDMANCPACELDTKVELELLEGNMDHAIATAYDLIHHKLSCYSMPFQTFCCLCYYLVRAGDERASLYFDMAMEEYDKSDAYDTSVFFAMTILMYYMHHTQQEESWAYFEKISEWEIDSEDVHRYNFAIHMLPMLKEGGKKTLNISPKMAYYEPDGIYDLAALRVHYYQQAADLADRFDTRNGNTHFTDQFKRFAAE
ncbi:hypothetical protein [Flavobacterium sp. JP2137]|uniref:hypothetical protein n=1 Tax=Flavobacterium sp. JP2137 TaxID=3414510 RepID=UPI003D2FCD12